MHYCKLPPTAPSILYGSFSSKRTLLKYSQTARNDKVYRQLHQLVLKIRKLVSTSGHNPTYLQCLQSHAPSRRQSVSIYAQKCCGTVMHRHTSCAQIMRPAPEWAAEKKICTHCFSLHKRMSVEISFGGSYLHFTNFTLNVKYWNLLSISSSDNHVIYGRSPVDLRHETFLTGHNDKHAPQYNKTRYKVIVTHISLLPYVFKSSQIFTRSYNSIIWCHIKELCVHQHLIALQCNHTFC